MTEENKNNCLTLHPDDAKDKVFAAILNALIKLGNTPSSPKELANTILKHKLAPLGGQTPFATVSSRISRHFKRAAEHNPPRSPLLTKHIHQHHSRKISYSLATEESIVKRMQTSDEEDTIPTVNNFNSFIPVTKELNKFKIIKTSIAKMEFYQMDDDDQNKVLRFIKSNQQDDQISQLKTGYINAAHLRKAAVPVLGEGLFNTDKETVVMITKGPIEIQGAWVTLQRARELIEEFEIESSVGLTKLLSDHPLDDPAAKTTIAHKDEKRPVTILPRKIAPSTKHLTTTEILKSLNIQNLNLPTIHQADNNLNEFLPFGNLSPLIDLSTLFQLPLFNETTIIPKKVLPPIVYPLQPTDPPMTITLLDRVAVCTAILKKHEEGIEKEYRLMRRLDNGFINGTQLLIAGGIDTERERSMILSFEMSRVRIPNKQSNLFGTWIPSRRAQELAATCSILHALGAFLDEDIESLFPTPLPISRRSSNSLNNNSNNNQHSLLPSNTTATTTIAAATDLIKKEEEVHFHQLLNPNNTLKMAEINTSSFAPLLGNFVNTDHDKHIMVIDKPCLNHEPSESTDEETDIDYDVEQVRKEIRQIRDAAIAAMEIGNSMQLDDDLFENQLSIHSPSSKPHKQSTSRIRRRKRKIKKNQIKEDEDPVIDVQYQYARNRYSTGGKGGGNTKITTIVKKRKDSLTKKTKKKEQTLVTHTVVNEDDEDEDVDIGGTDNDDDLR